MCTRLDSFHRCSQVFPLPSIPLAKLTRVLSLNSFQPCIKDDRVSQLPSIALIKLKHALWLDSNQHRRHVQITVSSKWYHNFTLSEQMLTCGRKIILPVSYYLQRRTSFLVPTRFLSACSHNILKKCKY